MKIVKSASLFTLILLAVACSPAYAAGSSGLEQVINNYVQTQWRASNIPGLTVSVVKGDQVIYDAHLGYADAETQQPVTDTTLFELGSNTKAFTALAVLQLEKQGLLVEQAPVARYLSWFWMQFEGQRIPITIGQLLHHTSGIGAETLNAIPASTAANALETTVRMLVGTDLKHKPGQVFEYATINYDVLGLIIEKVSGETYEQYIHDHILLPLGLNHTYVGRESLPHGQLPVGYKICFAHPCRYNAPDYRGNTPAGYIISDQEDMIRWGEIQLGIASIPAELAQLVQDSHLPDRSVPPDDDGSSYAAGWQVFQIGDGLISHSGSNPNFSSYIGFLPAQKVAVVVLANMDYGNTTAIGEGILDLSMGRDLPQTTEDLYTQVDRISLFLLVLCILISLPLLWFIGSEVYQIVLGRRNLVSFKRRKIIEIAASLVLLGLFVLSLYLLPDLVFQGMPWGFVLVWGPETILSAAELVAVTGGLAYLYYLIATTTYGIGRRPYYWLTAFSIISGIGNAFIIFVVNETFVRTDNLTNGLLFYFCIGIITYVCGQRFVRRKVIELTNNLLFKQRVDLLRALQDTPYRDFELLDHGNVMAGLNNDTEVISNSISQVVTSLTNLVTLLCCLIYLGFLNSLGLLVAIVVIGCAAGFYFFLGQRAEKFWEETRDSQNRFFQLISDLLGGFKELQLNSRRRMAFQQDIEKSCNEYREKRAQGENRFTDVFVMGGLLFTIVIGFVAFLYPSIFPGVDTNILRNYVFVFLYMTGPVNAVMGGYPQLIRIRVSWKRLRKLSQLLARTRIQHTEKDVDIQPEETLQIELHDLQFQYEEEDGRTFTLGPINYMFRSGEISFITGGNGSGKSTLARLITGLYTPDAGCIRVNGAEISPERLREHYSAIFSDFFLFEKLYGLILDGKEQIIQEHLDMLCLAEKVSIANGKFSTIQLSSGQRKRLALLVSYLEERPVCLYDEWASDQDPEYRAFFYNDILPALRARGKCVIIITHDDRYFGLADTILKLEMGKVVPVLVEGR